MVDSENNLKLSTRVFLNVYVLVDLKLLKQLQFKDKTLHFFIIRKISIYLLKKRSINY